MKNYIVYDGCQIGYIDHICKCDKCKERGEAEVFINDLDDGYQDCVKVHDLKSISYFGTSLGEAMNTLIKINDYSKEVNYLQELINFYSKELVSVKTERIDRDRKVKIEPLKLNIKHKNVNATETKTTVNGSFTVTPNKETKIIDGIEDVGNYVLYVKINEIIDVINKQYE